MKTKPRQISGSGAKWLPGAMAVAAAGGTSQAATVQITFSNSYVSSFGISTLVTDFGGDGIDDVSAMQGGGIRAHVNFALGDRLYALAGFTSNYLGNVFARISGLGIGVGTGYGMYMRRPYGSSVSVSLPSTLRPIQFSDSNIRGGAVTNAWIQVSAFAREYPGLLGGERARVTLERLIFNDTGGALPTDTSAVAGAHTEFIPVPEPSCVALLALGAAGLLIRRNRKDSAGGAHV